MNCKSLGYSAAYRNEFNGNDIQESLSLLHDAFILDTRVIFLFYHLSLLLLIQIPLFSFLSYYQVTLSLSLLTLYYLLFYPTYTLRGVQVVRWNEKQI
jgi:hypothetical protein